MAGQPDIQHRPFLKILAPALTAVAVAALAIAVALWMRKPAPHTVDRIESGVGSLRDFNLLLISIDTLRADHVGCYG